MRASKDYILQKIGLLKFSRYIYKNKTILHNHCIRCILGVSHQLQWREDITTEQLDMVITEWINVLSALHRLRWLGHVGRVDNDCLPKYGLSLGAIVYMVIVPI